LPYLIVTIQCVWWVGTKQKNLQLSSVDNYQLSQHNTHYLLSQSTQLLKRPILTLQLVQLSNSILLMLLQQPIFVFTPNKF
jgi:hypothetical protein